MTAEGDQRFMALALTLGGRGLGSVWPNPAVGCVIVNGGRIVGRGWTQTGGRPHAETMALAQAGKGARGATAYVSLEPCAHHGKTPPCAAALISAGVVRVVSALTDPDPRVAGRGHAMLVAAGLKVDTGVGAVAAERMQRGFLSRIRIGRPMLTLKLATSLDGRIATASGESQWITGSAARAMVHLMRARHDAILIGSGTARADDPLLTVRGLGPVRQPVRVVAARALDLSLDGQLARTAQQVPLWLLHGASAPMNRRADWRGLGARLFEVPEVPQGLNLAVALGLLGQEGLTRVFCEGGGQLAAALMQQDLADDLALFSAGLVLGAGGRAAIGGLADGGLQAAPHFQLQHSRPVGPDLFSLWSRA